MLKEITRNDVLNTLRQHEIRFSKHPNSNNIITLPRQEWNEDAQCPEFFDVDIRISGGPASGFKYSSLEVLNSSGAKKCPCGHFVM
jgi:hypothetical protein